MFKAKFKSAFKELEKLCQTDSENDNEVVLDLPIISSQKYDNILDKWQVDKVGCNMSYIKGKIIITEIPGSAHDSASRFFSFDLYNAAISGEAKTPIWGSGSGRNAFHNIRKEPDESFGNVYAVSVRGVNGERLPTVVIEIGYPSELAKSTSGGTNIYRK